jgi:acyl-CoA thioesterase-1
LARRGGRAAAPRGMLEGMSLALLAILLATAVRSGDASAASPFTYVALGDSLGAGFGAREGGYADRLHRRLRGERPGAVLRNFSVNGATTADVLRGQLPRVASLHPSLATVEIGVNDLTHRVPLEQLTANYRQILRALRATGAVVTAANLPDLALAPAVPPFLRDEIDRRVREVNRRLAEVAAAEEVPLFDLYTVTRTNLPGHPEYFSADGFHPSDAGYERWAEMMWPLVRQVLAERGPR